MKWASITIAYNEKDFIGGHCQNMIDCGIDKNIVLISDRPFFGDPIPHDNTDEIAESYGCDVIKGYWKADDPMLNCGMYFLRDKYDMVLFTAPDEYLLPEDFKKMDKFIEENKDKAEAFAISNMNTYFKEYFYRIEPKETHRTKYIYKPVIAINPKKSKWVDLRATTAREMLLPEEIILWHFSYYRSDDFIKDKMKINSNANIVQRNWYENVWKKWTPDSLDFHVEFPEQFHSVVTEYPPKEITKYLKDHCLFKGEV